jgi:hypothetical protein
MHNVEAEYQVIKERQRDCFKPGSYECKVPTEFPGLRERFHAGTTGERW